MKKGIFPVLAVLLVAALAIPAMAAWNGVQKPSLVIADVVTVTARVRDMDFQQRSLTLQLPEGRLFTVKVSDAVQNFDEIRKGDPLVVKYCEPVAVFIRRAGGKPEADELNSFEVAPRSHKPSGTVVNTTEVSARVEAVNHKRRTLTVKGSDGNPITLKVDKSVADLDKIRGGSNVVLRLTEALAISILKP